MWKEGACRGMRSPEIRWEGMRSHVCVCTWRWQGMRVVGQHELCRHEVCPHEVSSRECEMPISCRHISCDRRGERRHAGGGAYLVKRDPNLLRAAQVEHRPGLQVYHIGLQLQ